MEEKRKKTEITLKQMRDKIEDVFQDWYLKISMMSLDHLKDEVGRIRKEILMLLDQHKTAIQEKLIKIDKLPNPDEALTTTKRKMAEDFNQEIKDILGKQTKD